MLVHHTNPKMTPVDDRQGSDDEFQQYLSNNLRLKYIDDSPHAIQEFLNCDGDNPAYGISKN